jgi:hypothetical protein
LTTCRVFHQIVVFLAPRFQDLDGSIKGRTSWVLNVEGRGEFTAWEVTQSNTPFSRGQFIDDRFVDVFPDPAKHRDPEVRQLWKEYLQEKKRFSKQGTDKLALDREFFKDHCRSVIREVLGGLPRDNDQPLVGDDLDGVEQYL